MGARNNTYLEMIIETMKNLGGKGHYSAIYEEFRHVYMKYYGCEPAISNKAWQSGIRGTIERYSSDSKCFNGSKDIFYHIGDEMSGMWGLR